MKIVQEDLKTLRFCIVVLHELLNVATDEKEIKNLRMHVCRIRKISALLLPAINQNTLDFARIINKGIPDDSDLAKSLIKAKNELTLPQRKTY